MTKKQNYFRMVESWKKKYDFKVDINAVKSYSVCEKCGKKAVHRHHKGHEFLLACYDPDNWAKRYIEFRPEDIVRLCLRCHILIHRALDRMIPDFYDAINKYGEIQRAETCRNFHSIFVNKTNSWLRRKL